MPLATAAPSPRRCRRRRSGRRAPAGPKRSVALAPLVRVEDEPVGDLRQLVERGVAEPGLPTPAEEDREIRDEQRHGHAGGALARGPQSRSEMTSEQTCPCSPARTKQRRSTSPSSASRGSSGRGRRRIVRDGWRSPIPRSVSVAASTQRSGTQARCVMTLVRRFGALPGAAAACLRRPSSCSIWRMVILVQCRLHERPSRWISSSAETGPQVPAA